MIRWLARHMPALVVIALCALLVAGVALILDSLVSAMTSSP